MALSLFIVSNCPAAESASSDTQASQPVVLERVVSTNITKDKKYPGTVRASRTANLAFRVAGPLVRVDIKPGDAVKKGQILMQIDPQDYEDRIRVLKAQKAGAVSQLQTAALDYARIQTLFEKKVVPEVDYDHARNGVNTLKASVDAVEAQLVIARHQLAYTTLRAPFDAIITARFIDNYEMVQPGRPVAGLHDIDTLEVEIKVSENEILRQSPRRGAMAFVAFPARPDTRFKMLLNEFNTSADPVTRTYSMVFNMLAPDVFTVLPGMTADVFWSAGEGEKSGITVPSKAIVTNTSGDSSVWVFDDATSTAQMKKVEVGGLNGSSRILIKAGLIPGERIVVEGVDFIRSNMRLNAVQTRGSIE
jgi:RND family efflux transporter MFP subunit